jgi:DNA-binding transcriptional regulator YhcF (GntR family)
MQRGYVMERKIDSTTSFKLFYEEQKNNEEIREKRRKNAQRSRAVAQRLIQLKKQGLPIEEIMDILTKEFPT